MAEVNLGRPREGLGVGARRRRAPAPSQEPTRQREGVGGRSPSTGFTCSGTGFLGREGEMGQRMGNEYNECERRG